MRTPQVGTQTAGRKRPRTATTLLLILTLATAGAAAASPAAAERPAWTGEHHLAAVDSPASAPLLTAAPPRLVDGVVEGVVADHNDNLPVADATVRALDNGAVIRSTTTADDGTYDLALPLGTYTIEATATNYATATADVVLDEPAETVTRHFALRTARGTLTSTSLEMIVPPGLSRSQTVTLRNTGSSDMTWRATDPVPWLYALPPTLGTLAPGATRTIQIVALAAGVSAGVYDITVLIRTNSGRQADLLSSVRVVVAGYFVGVNAGARGYLEPSGDYWGIDTPYQRGSWGYTNPRSTADSIFAPIAGTTHDRIYQSLRLNPVEYRFDGLPPGVYEIDLRFAEFTPRPPNTRLADVIAENELLLPAHDIANEVGSLTADQHVFYVPVTDGQLNLRFVQRFPHDLPIVNAIQVTHRPDRQPTAAGTEN